MIEVILQTKLHIPSLRPAQIQRKQLLDKLNDRLQTADGRFSRKLTLVSAPPGFGKTTLISNWLHQLDLPASWLSLDAGDNEPGRLLYTMIVALQQAQPELGDSALSLLQAPQRPPMETLLTLLINDLANMAGQVIFVLDDYHVIQDLEIHKAITYLLENQPPQLHLVIISRSDPALPLHRLQGSGQMRGVFVRDLRFTDAEAASFLDKTMGLSLSHEETNVLTRRTEGWVAGLQLAALSMQAMPDPGEFVTVFAGDDRYISDYLMGEVLDHQPPHLQEFLLKSAIVDRFCGSLCDALLAAEDQGLADSKTTGGRSSQAIIQRLEQSNLFISNLDNRREWYRYHPLFADFLRQRQKNRPAAQIADLHRRAAAWYNQHGFIEEAIEHYHAIKDFAQVANLIERVAIRLVAQGRPGKVLDWLAGLPDEVIKSRPLLCVSQAWILTISGQTGAAEPLLRQAEQVLATSEPHQAQHASGLIDMVRAYQARRQGNLPGSITLLRQASDNIAVSDLLVRSSVRLNLGFNHQLMGELPQAQEVLQAARFDGQTAGAVYITLIAMAVQGNNDVAQGNLRRAITLYKEAIDYGLARNHGRPFPPAGYAYAGLGQVMYEQNQIEEAEQLLTLAVQLGKSISDWSMVRRGLLPKAWMKAMAGDLTEARKLWQQALDVVQQAGSERLKDRLQAQWVRMQLTCETPDSAALASAAAWAKTYQESRPDVFGFQEAQAQMVLAQVELVQGQIDQAIWRLGRLAEEATASGQNDNLIKMQSLAALAHDANGDGETALEKLGRALALAANGGYVRTFVDYGSPMQRLLQRAAEHGPAADYAARLRSAFPAASQPAPHPAGRGEPDPLVDPLTDVELSIVRLMAAGLSNGEIAGELFLSVNTVKVYASRLYAKLGVHRRGEAAAVARELHLI
jgi:LuxR family maltose regulon positive regulatory protein